MNRTMKGTTIVALLVVAMTLLMVGGVVLAKNITCTGGNCVGTKKADDMLGTFGNDTILGRGGNDTIIENGGDDVIRGGGGNDTINDTGPGPDVDTIFGGKGDDTIFVNESTADVDPDFVDCGPGIVTVFVDPTDTRLNCEILNPKD